ncbi:hypothetical protein BU23DRAFT_643128 [Bimuria novae-zelandiae CBS 107.79]|uniref:Uncharacterized protein n=1 Tax=Bimuria novae-zelandiae CBS 107.79 TaxID=1447943 RepID=A0A6A5VNY9_9PLEO|nr:hypothetical protein BU23DRAFT_643128 [Bimuria novae-zelandiae CBS 107.79]
MPCVRLIGHLSYKSCVNCSSIMTLAKVVLVADYFRLLVALPSVKRLQIHRATDSFADWEDFEIRNVEQLDLFCSTLTTDGIGHLVANQRSLKRPRLVYANEEVDNYFTLDLAEIGDALSQHEASLESLTLNFVRADWIELCGGVNNTVDLSRFERLGYVDLEQRALLHRNRDKEQDATAYTRVLPR